MLDVKESKSPHPLAFLQLSWMQYLDAQMQCSYVDGLPSWPRISYKPPNDASAVVGVAGLQRPPGVFVYEHDLRRLYHIGSDDL